MTTKKIAVAVLLSLVFLTGCTDSATRDTLSEIEQAQTKNQDWENGTFEVSHTTESTIESSVIRTEGSFIKAEDGEYNWYKADYNEGTSPFSESLVLDGRQYQKFALPEGVTEWQEMPGVTVTFKDQLNPLFEMEKLTVDAVSTEEVDGAVRYQLTLNESHGKQMREDNVNALRENLVLLRGNDISEEVIQNIEAELEAREQTEYTDLVYSYQIDEAGHLTSVQYEATITDPEEVVTSLISSFTVTEYNLADETGLLPEFE